MIWETRWSTQHTSYRKVAKSLPIVLPIQLTFWTSKGLRRSYASLCKGPCYSWNCQSTAKHVYVHEATHEAKVTCTNSVAPPLDEWAFLAQTFKHWFVTKVASAKPLRKWAIVKIKHQLKDSLWENALLSAPFESTTWKTHFEKMLCLVLRSKHHWFALSRVVRILLS